MQSLKKGDWVAIANVGRKPPERFFPQLQKLGTYLGDLGFNALNYLDFNKEYDSEVQSEIINSCILNKKIKAIFPICSGSFDFSMLNLINYSAFSANPKIICGYSSISPLLFVASYISRVPTFYGPHLNTLSSYSSQRENMFSVYSFWNLFCCESIGKSKMGLQEKKTFYCYPNTESKLEFKNIYSHSNSLKHRYINLFCKKKYIKGRLFATTLRAFSMLIDYYPFYFSDDFVLIIDIFDQSYQEIVTDIKKVCNSINMVNCRCIYISTIHQIQLSEYADNDEKIYELLKDLHNNIIPTGVELLYGFPLGHSKYKLTLPMGVISTIVVETGEIIVDDFWEVE